MVGKNICTKKNDPKLGVIQKTLWNDTAWVVSDRIKCRHNWYPIQFDYDEQKYKVKCVKCGTVKKVLV